MESLGWLLFWIWLGLRVLLIAAVVYLVVWEVRRAHKGAR